VAIYLSTQPPVMLFMLYFVGKPVRYSRGKFSVKNIQIYLIITVMLAV